MDGAPIAVQLPASLIVEVTSAAHAAGLPPTVVLVSALAGLLHRYERRTPVRLLVTNGPPMEGSTIVRVDLTQSPRGGELITSVLHGMEGATAGPEEADATFAFTETPEGALVQLRFRGGTLDTVLAGQVASHYRNLLDTLTARPEMPLSEIPLVTPQEQRLILDDWQGPSGVFPRDVCLHHLFAQQAAATPDTIAVTATSGSLTYRELDTRANQLAHHLRDQGVGPGVRVGLCLERSLEMMVALWGVLKAGAAFVPLDPEAPAARLAALAEDAGLPLVLTTSALAPKVTHAGVRAVLLDVERHLFTPGAPAPPVTGAAATDAAYVIYTSGSTGTPKGVLVTHRSVVNFREGILHAYFAGGPRPFQQVALNSPIFFDASVEEWLCLLDGCTLHLPSEEVRKDPFAYLAYLRERGVQCFSATPSQVQVLVAAGLLTDAGLRLQTVMVGGEAIPAPLWTALGKAPGTPFFNTYGPTEATVEATYCRITPGLPTPVIGRPLLNVRAYVLDPALNPLPVGVPGELHLGGPGVAEGYLHRPDLTAERFVPDPFCEEAGARMYRTGDLARWLPDGTLEFLGRVDHQVKIRGHRIELGEIEATLERHPAVASAVVLAREDTPGDKRLVSYFLPASGADLTVLELREFLQRTLPEYMVPTAFVEVDAWPLTPSGKVDRAALQAPGETRLALGTEHVAPATRIEEVLSRAWAEVLRVSRVGVHDDFFALGGNSLLATQVLSRVRDAFGVILPLRVIYDGPTVHAVAKAVDATVATTPSHLPPLEPLATRDGLPLSMGQSRLWFEQQWDPASPAYNVPLLLRLAGPLELRALEGALAAILARHEVLRTRFEARPEGRIVQRIAPPAPVPLERATARDEAEAWGLVEAAVARPFDLATGPLFRVHLIEVAPDTRYLLLNFHHACTDGWSQVVLLRELEALYNGLRSGHEPHLPPLPVQYADFGQWERIAVEAGAFSGQLDYWREQLRGVPVLELPTDRPRPAVKRQCGAVQAFQLPHALSARLAALARHEGVSLHMALLAAFQVLLHRYTGQEDIAVGTPSAGRTRTETEGLLGFFVNTLVLRGDLSGDPSFRELLARTRRVCLAAHDNQDLPFERLVNALAPGRDPSRSPLFQVMFALQNTEVPVARLDGLTTTILQVKPQATMFDLTLDMEETPEGLRGTLEHSTDLFEASTAARFLKHFEALLESLTGAPEERLSRHAFLPPEERAFLLHTLNATEMELTEDRCVHELVAAHAARAPDHPALVMGQQVVTYRDLNSRANGLARRLRGLGVKLGTPVAVCTERSFDGLIAQLAVLKAGGAYVPLDPAYPAERQAYILHDTGAPVLLTQARLRTHSLQVPAGTTVILLDALASDATGASAEDLPPVASSRDPAYIIYTSGSTGTPKGVVVEHRSLLNLVSWHNRAYSVTPHDHASHLAGLAFDASVWETWPYLAAGATLHLPPEEARVDPEALQGWLVAHGITLCFAPTPIAERLLDLSWPEATRLRALLTGGDRLTRAPSPTLPFALVNHYGPTESTVVATAGPVPATSTPDGRTPSIGRPIANITAYVLDPHRNLVPLGVPGELHLGGEGLARGYLHLCELTAERFIPDPFSTKPGARLYRTGDRVRWRADGTLEFLGRVDHQVKIRGHRIELGEIEATLARHPHVSEALVLAREDSPGDKRLVAYVVPRSGEELTGAELREFLKGWLPAYMVPPHAVLLDAFPLTPNGKVDRKALPAPAPEGHDENTPHEAPRTPGETTLAAVWEEVLRVPRVGIHDNFFELGGDSILSIQVVARARARGLHLTSRQVFQHQTVAQLAAVAEHALAGREEQGPVTGCVPLTPIQRWFFEQDLPDRHHFNQSFLLEAPGDLDPLRLEAALRHLCLHHDALRLRFVPGPDGSIVQEMRDAADAAPAFATLDLSSIADAEARREALEAEAERLQRTLDIARGPLVQAALVTLGHGEGKRVLLVIHHLAVDAVSWRILLEDLERAYLQGPAADLGPKTTSFKRWAEGLSEHARSGKLQEERAFWLAQAAPADSGLPVDLPGGANTHASARTVEVALTPDETRALLQEVPKAFGTRINDALLAALAQAFHRWTGTPELHIALEGHGREELWEGVDLSRTVGWFTTMFPVRLDLGDTPEDPVASLKRVKAHLGAIPTRGLGYGVLRYLTPRDEALATLPAPQVSFNYLGQYDAAATPRGLFRPATEERGREWAAAGTRAALFDITGAVTGGALSFEFVYSENLHARATVERLARAFRDALATLVDRARTGAHAGHVPSDFPLARLDQATLDKVLDGRGEWIEDLYPVAPMQEGMLFHARLDPGSGVYLEQAHLVLEGRLDAPALHEAWRHVVARHPILRTAFLWKALDKPLQAVHRRVDVPFLHEDWRPLDAIEQEARLTRFLQEDRARGLALETPPLLRIHVTTWRDDLHHLVWTFHHTLLDGWSIPLVLQEVLTTYRHLLAGGTTDPRAPTVPPYGEYIAWLARQDAAAAERYWRGELAGFHAPTPFTVDVPKARADPSDHPGEASLRVPREAHEALQAFARRHRLTLNTLLQGAWSLLLARYSGERDVLFGATVSGRPDALEGVEAMVGLFINTVPVRVDADPEARVDAWLAQLQDRQAERQRFEHASLVEVQTWSDVPSGTPLFESLLVFENYPPGEATDDPQAPLRVREYDVIEKTNYPLTLAVLPGADLSLHLHYDRARFGTATATRLLGHLRTLLEGMVASPTARLADIPLLPPDERDAVVHGWNATATDPPAAARTLHEGFRAWVERTPDAVALVHGTARLTYAELDARANRVAHHLQRLGVGPETLVGLCMARTPDMVIALLGVLKAGGAYVPLDPHYPQERLRFMMEDARVQVLLTQADLQDRLPSVAPHVLCLDRDLDALLGEEPPTPPPALVTPRTLAYVIYTSGSTGRPKGVLVEHEGTCSLAAAQARLFGVGPGSRVLQFASMSFDASVWELVMALLNGGTLVLPDGRGPLVGAELAHALREGAITHATLPPSAVRTLTPGPFPTLRTLVMAGEACPPDLAETWSQRCAVFNAYGPTETTVCATVHRCTGTYRTSPPIGRPIPNMRVHVLDAQGNPLPVGVPGEIAIGGVGVARGYLHRPELTAEKFIPDPFSGVPGARLYRTGDLGRWTPEGELEFLGRRDHQVKVRGFRIELGEIEATLLTHPDLKEAFVMARDDLPGDPRLVAYVVPRDPTLLHTAELGEFLKRTLPAHLVPGWFVPLEALPLTPNGKVDRKALPAPDACRTSLADAYVAPTTPTEAALVRIWQDVLGVEPIGIRDDFFALGGHSLLATRVASRIHDAFRVEVPLKTLFSAPTIEALAPLVVEALLAALDTLPEEDAARLLAELQGE